MLLRGTFLNGLVLLVAALSGEPLVDEVIGFGNSLREYMQQNVYGFEPHAAKFCTGCSEPALRVDHARSAAAQCRRSW
jgi:hypothetical protein